MQEKVAPGREGALLPRPPLETVRVSFPTHGLCLTNARGEPHAVAQRCAPSRYGPGADGLPARPCPSRSGARPARRRRPHRHPCPSGGLRMRVPPSASPPQSVGQTLSCCETRRTSACLRSGAIVSSPIRFVTNRPSLLPPSSARTLIGVPRGCLPLRERYGMSTFRACTEGDVGPACSPVAVYLRGEMG